MNLNSRYLLLFMIVFCCCKPVVKKLGDNPAVDYYIVGRIRTAQIPLSGNPYKVKVFALDPSLIDQPFKFKMLDSTSFVLTWLLNGQEEQKPYVFGKEINEKAFHLLISKNDTLTSKALSDISYIDFQFCVKGEIIN